MELTKSDKINKYQNGKIYTIRSYQTDKFYIGSTCSPLHKRLYQHKAVYKSYLKNSINFISSFDIIKYEDCYIELMEFFKCNTKNELEKRENELIRDNLYNIVNRSKTGLKLNSFDNEFKIKNFLTTLILKTNRRLDKIKLNDIYKKISDKYNNDNYISINLLIMYLNELNYNIITNIKGEKIITNCVYVTH